VKLTQSSDTGLTYVAEVAEEVRDQAALLLSLVARGARSVRDGDQMRLDWGIVRLARTGYEVTVQEPDYRGDPRRYVPGLNFTCAVLKAQQLVHDRLVVSAAPIAYDQFVSVYPGGLTAPVTAAIRQTAQADLDTGWRIFDADRIDWAAELQARRVYEFARERAALLGALALPEGWAVRFEGRTLVESVSPEGSRRALSLTLDL
jgi:hypothetical protein